MREISTLSLGSSSDLVVKCGWSPGIISADEPILPGSRLAITFRTLFELRKRAREALEPAFADPIERLEKIHSFRLAAEEDGLRLSVTYDFGWETYMRALWAETGAGPFLDLLCCHCAGYRLARDTPLYEWEKWIRKHQVQSHYFYSATALTVGDLATLSQGERLQRDDVDVGRSDRALAGFPSLSAEDLAEAKRLSRDYMAQEQGIGVIFTMYRLTRYWTADVAKSAIPEDAITLIRATRALIENSFTEPNSLNPSYERTFRRELQWYRQKIDKPRQASTMARPNDEDIQRGILTSFDEPGRPITHGAAVFLAVTVPKEARGSLAGLALRLANEKEAPADGVFRNLAFTHSGLQQLRMETAILDGAPGVFREGAAKRAGSVGDLRSFHPDKWKPLRRNWAPDPGWEVEPGQIDVLVQLRVSSEVPPTAIDDPAHPLFKEIQLLAGLKGLELLAVEGLAPAGEPGSGVDHLGFRDGVSQPMLSGEETRPWSDQVEPGALLVGRGTQTVHPFWMDGSFLAVRRMTIDRTRFEELLDGDSHPGLKDRGLLAAKILGRKQDGTRLGSGRTGNNFVFDGDEAGAVCPLESHIRRANPRRPDTPRIMRRGMSFGPPVKQENRADETRDERPAERGSFFMAYCADLAEQYERILGWVNGGNSTRAGSYLADPLAGPPDHSGRTYRFLHDGGVQRLAIPDPKKAAIGLSWSLYFFAPSLPAIRALDGEPAPLPDPSPELVKEGLRIIAKLKKEGPEAWRAVLNEPAARDRETTAAIWAAIRSQGGILETPPFYLVGGYDLVLEVLRDDGRRFSNREAGKRLKQTIGRFHLGLDPHTDDYVKLSKPANDALRSVGEKPAFELARAATKETIHEILKATNAKQPDVMIDLISHLIEPVLARIAKPWFDIPDEKHVRTGAHDWTLPEGRELLYPGDFWNASRDAFNPFQSSETNRMAIAEAKAAVAAASELIRLKGRDKLDGSVSRQMADATDAYPTEAELAQVLVGCMIGGVPTVVGNAVRLLVEGLDKGILGRGQRSWLRTSEAERTFEAALQRFAPMTVGLLLRAPVPEVLQRTVATDGVELGGLPLKKDKALIFSLESAGLDRIAHGVRNDNYIPFGMAVPSDDPPTPHGCPGREMANGTILGLLVGLLESARFRPGPRGLAVIRPL